MEIMLIKPGDHLYITGTHRDLTRFCLDIGVITNRIKNVIIVVGGKIAYYLSKQLSTQGIKVKIIEKDKNRCQILAEKYHMSQLFMVMVVMMNY